MRNGLNLPLSSMRFLVPPVRLMSAYMWQVAQQRCVDQYGKLAEFISLVTQMVPELLSFRQRAQLILGLRARLTLELLQSVETFDPQAIQDNLNTVRQWTTNCLQEEGLEERVEISKLAFVELVQTLLDNPSERKDYFKDVFPVQYGACFDTALQILVWEFLSRLEEFLPVPSFSQIASSSSPILLDSDEVQQFVPDSEDLKMLLQHHRQHKKLEKNQFSFESDTILSTLASKHTSEVCKDEDEHTKITREVPVDLPSLENNCLEVPVNNERKLKCHLRRKDNSCSTKKHSCPQCGKTFKSHHDMKRHQNTVHSLVKPFKCNQCENKFKTKLSLKNHLQIHTGHKPYLCSYCNRAFRTKEILKEHVRTHTGERPYACTLCEKKFTQMTILRVHLRVHKGERPYLCSDCGKAFCDSGALLVHSRHHTGERPYHCDVCGKGYITSHKLKEHQRYHTGERPYPCTYCEKCFHNQSGLKRHSRTHTGEKPFQCPKCDKRFSEKSNMRVHLRSHRDSGNQH